MLIFLQQGTYGVTTSGNSLRINFVTKSSQTNVGARLYLMADNTHYEKFSLLNKEFTFDVDVSHLPCGLNGVCITFISYRQDLLAKYFPGVVHVRHGG